MIYVYNWISSFLKCVIMDIISLIRHFRLWNPNEHYFLNADTNYKLKYHHVIIHPFYFYGKYSALFQINKWYSNPDFIGDYKRIGKHSRFFKSKQHGSNNN